MDDQFNRLTAALADRYSIQRELGAGGMATVYLAEDLKHHRPVAIKVLRPELVAALGVDRFLLEIEIAARLNHPHILTLIDSGTADDFLYYVMPQVEGEELRDVIAREKQLPVADAIRIAEQVAAALDCAHREGVVHRDVKPDNVLLHEGEAMLTDFGIALAAHDAEDTRLTGTGLSLGTPSYMSPEQATGSKKIDARTDVYSLGCMLYEMLGGQRPFHGETPLAMVAAIITAHPPPLSKYRADLPSDLVALVMRCLERDPDKRPSTGGALRDELLQLRQTAGEPASALARPRTMVPVALIVLAAVIGGAWMIVQKNQAAAFAASALPQIEQLAREQQFTPAYNIALEVERVAGVDEIPPELWAAMSVRLSIESDPPANVSMAFDSDGAWTELGITPLTDVRVPRGMMHWRVEKDGYVTAERLGVATARTLSFKLPSEDDPDMGMVRVPAGDVDLWGLGGVRAQTSVRVDEFLIDRHEVTNHEFAQFVEAGGYERPEFWTQEFRDDDRVLSFEDAAGRFRDATGRPGPATWELGTYPAGEQDLPVGGVSWYEAAAYAAFEGKELPTIYHWYFADNAGSTGALTGMLLRRANFEGTEPHRIGSTTTVGAYGAYDMAGNMREWSASASGSQRLILGGAWSDPSYVYTIPQIRTPFDRAEGNGFRTMKRLGSGGPMDSATLPLTSGLVKDYRNLEPVSDEVFRVFRSLYESEKVPLEPVIEETDESSEHWIRQRVSFAAGYGNERMTALLFLPRNSQPPYQTVVGMGGVDILRSGPSATENDLLWWAHFEYLVRGGRALLVPQWKGSYERADGFHFSRSGSAAVREKTVQWTKELRQTLDYLESRSDIDPDKIAYQGISWGAMWAPFFLALEPRLKTGMLVIGGLGVVQTAAMPFPDDFDPFNYAPRVHSPVLMLNGRDDPIFPYETSQLPLFQRLGTPEGQKRHLTYPAGHSSFGWRNELFREGLDWLDALFGPP